MTPGAAVRIARGPGGEVEADGASEPLVRAILLRAGFFIHPALRGEWVRLPFDMGRNWENAQATWAAQMLTAARYPVDLDEDLRLREPVQPTRPVSSPKPSPPGRGLH